jgi:endonuclease/exonuclease/phosphatase family metal-dependent hydrolase
LFTLFGLLRLVGFATEPLLDSQEVHAIVGEPARVAAPASAQGPLTVVSWNIAQGTRYAEIRDTLAGIDADIFLLQEVDMRVGRSGDREVARDLANDLGGLNWVFAGEFQEVGEGGLRRPALTGQAVLSRYPIRDAFVLRFENQARLRWRLDPFQPRRGGRMALRAELGGVLVYNAHIESAKDDRFRHKQIDEMLADHARSEFAAGPVIFAGDFNTEHPPHASPIVRCLTDLGFVDALGASAGRRATSVAHEDPLDWIFVRNLAPARGRVVTVRRGVSDHFPLLAAVSIAVPALPARAGTPGRPLHR